MATTLPEFAGAAALVVEVVRLLGPREVGRPLRSADPGWDPGPSKGPGRRPEPLPLPEVRPPKGKASTGREEGAMLSSGLAACFKLACVCAQ